MAFLEHLKKALAAEEDLVHSITSLLNLFLAKTDLPQQKLDEIKNILEILTKETLAHKAMLEKIMAELEHHDK